MTCISRMKADAAQSRYRMDRSISSARCSLLRIGIIMSRSAWRIAILVGLVCTPQLAAAESGTDAWLRYPYISDAAVRTQYEFVPGSVVALGDSPVVQSARDELIRGLGSMLHRTVTAAAQPAGAGALV